MLDTDTKRRIDSCRDILVGKVPDPKSQVEQITIALIYKFMDDMDAEAEEMGGKRSFFAGDYTKYGWRKLMAPGMGGFDVLALYSEAIQKMNENPGIPALFRDIFKNAYLPYRDPETLRSFLKEIDGFTYDHSERLGDAFEYLLSVLGSQGDAGQFRTPRHIIDFMVEVIDPKKNETILDPACGTAGFLISAWKHILKQNTSPSPLAGEGRGEGAKARQGDQLTPDERKQLAANIHGYDISPDMVRLSLVNMYLHGFTDPHIDEYDTLTSEERWNHYSDIILANPPFMSPKGGIKPHKRFSVQATRSEVLFVDYIAEHLTPTGRAAVIVPEGIIFQSQTAYKALRKLLVENYLVAVVSLPAGVFQPYSGVKTSILILDKALARKADTIGFFKVENDGFGLGAQRRPIEKNDLPQIRAEVGEYLRRLRAGESVAEFQPRLALIVDKAKVAANDEYNLSGERFRENGTRAARFAHVRLATIAEIAAGNSAPQGDEYFTDGDATFVRTSDVGAVHLSASFIGSADKVNQKAVDELRLRLFPEGTILFPKSGASTFLNHRVVLAAPAYVSSHLACIICDEAKALPKYVYQLLCHVDARQITPDQAYPSLRLTEIGDIEIPLPPLDVQKEIVAEIEVYQKVIDGARAVLDNYRPHIPIHPEWPRIELGKVARLINGRAYKQEELLAEGPTPVLRVGNFFSNRGWYYSDLVLDEDKYCNAGDLLYAWSASFGPRIWDGPRAIYHYHIWKIETTDQIDKKFLYYLLEADSEQIKAGGNGIAMIHVTKGDMERREFPVPPLNVQQAIVAELEAEEALVSANRELIARFEKKIQATLARIWGEEEATPAES